MMNTDVKNVVGIDIAKKTFDLTLIANLNKNKLIYNHYDNDAKGIKEMKQMLKSNKINLNETAFCMEHTGIYCRPLVDFLIKNKCKTWLEMPIVIKRSMGLQRGKSDKLDSKNIALYAYKNLEDIKLWQPPREEVLKLKDLMTLRERLIKNKKSLKTPIKELKSIGDKKAATMLMDAAQAAIKGIEKSLMQVEQQLDEIIQSDDRLKELFRLLTSVPGVGKVTAINLICFTNEFTLYKSAKQLACYCGVAPFEHTSGTTIRGKIRVSHMANKILKTNLSLGARSIIQFNHELRAYYERKVAEGKNKMSVNNAIRNKIIHRVIAVIKRGTPYVKNNIMAA
jgi:transposase